ncbi:hypothetical protein L596_007320 [Steinernema carpocapsae]|uniref:Domain of unknown function DB domain-containing protein n=1 Tax=Steinernema carpocapsae TaxID=34508 RepID=A0A4U5P9L1_STECR|nr:hypothetical protein L596_007320 [Steinernema carpocapsae]
MLSSSFKKLLATRIRVLYLLRIVNLRVSTCSLSREGESSAAAGGGALIAAVVCGAAPALILNGAWLVRAPQRLSSKVISTLDQGPSVPILLFGSARSRERQMLPEPQSPRTALALSDLQTSTGGLGGFSVGGGNFNSSGGVNSWTTRGVGGAGGLLDQKPSGGFFGSSSSSSNQLLNPSYICKFWVKRVGREKFATEDGVERSKLLQRLLFLRSLRLQQLRLFKWIVQEMKPQLFPSSSMLFLVALVPVAFVLSADTLPSCDQIPQNMCCSSKVLEKCMTGCFDYVSKHCSKKLAEFDKIEMPAESREKPEEPEKLGDEIKERQVKPVKAAVPYEFSEETHAESKSARTHGVGAVDGLARGAASRASEIPSEGFIEQPSPSFSSGSSGSSGAHHVPTSSSSRSGGDYDLVRSQYPITEVSDADLTGECGTERSKPPFSPCLSRKNVDDLFLSCCQQHVPANCHSICQYEHREHVAAETLISAVQNDGCDLKYLSKVLYCANQNRDNRQCCRSLGLSGSELGVGERCLRMCNIARSGDRIGTVEKNDLVCLSNWNVIMYCARAGIRTIN